MIRWLIAFVLTAGCPRPIAAPPPPPAQDFGILADCPMGTTSPTSEYVCGNKQLNNGLRCVTCDVSKPCVFRNGLVYCTPTCDDPACK